MVSHFYTSRQVWGNKTEKAWEDYFTTLCTKYLNNKELLAAEVESYWEKISQPQNVYRLHNPPSLESRVNWEYEGYWKTATLASLQHAIETTSEINELRMVSGLSKRTLLGCAVSYAATYQMIEMLIDADADVNFPQEAPFEGHFSIFQLAVSLSSAKTVQFLLDKGVDIELASASGQFNRNNIMQHAALFAEQPESLLAVKYACDNSSLLIDNRGNTLIHYLAESDSDRSDFIDILIESGANIEEKNNRFTQRQSLPNCEPEFGGEQTALLSSLGHSLELYNHGCEGSAALENLKCLLEHGASVSATDAHGRNAFHVLSVSRRYDSNELEKLRLLQSNGADINAKDIKGETPLFNAVQSKSLEFINTLIELGADCDVVSKDETSVFCSACFRSVDKDDKASKTEFFGILERLLDKSTSQKEMAGFWDEPVSILKARLNRGYLQLSDVPIKSPLYPFLKDLL